jgi:hypothetical protein
METNLVHCSSFFHSMIDCQINACSVVEIIAGNLCFIIAAAKLHIGMQYRGVNGYTGINMTQ